VESGVVLNKKLNRKGDMFFNSFEWRQKIYSEGEVRERRAMQ